MAHWFRLVLEAGAMIWLCTIGVAVLAHIGLVARRVQRRIMTLRAERSTSRS